MVFLNGKTNVIDKKSAPILLLTLAMLLISGLAGCQSIQAQKSCQVNPPIINPINLTDATILRPGQGSIIANGQYWSDQQLTSLMLYIEDLEACSN